MFATLGGCFLRETFATGVETQGLLELAVCLERVCVEVNLEAWDLSRLLESAFFSVFFLFFSFSSSWIARMKQYKRLTSASVRTSTMVGNDPPSNGRLDRTSKDNQTG